jgi:hypothetical protein
MSRRAKDKICGDGAIVSVHIRDNKGDNPIEVIAKPLLLGLPTETLGASIVSVNRRHEIFGSSQF